MKNFVLLTFILFILVACQDQDNKPQVVAGHWGHQKNLVKQTENTKTFLYRVKKDDTYDVCLAQYMVKHFPGVEAEIRAAINLWAYYIGREIKINVNIVDLAEPSGESIEDLQNLYYSDCPKKTDLVVGLAELSGSDIGITYYTQVKRENIIIKETKRTLFLKKNYTWKTLAQLLEKELTEQNILELSKKRNKSILLQDNFHLTFRTILHEVGHIWGLCDQYEKTHCDPHFATLDEKNEIYLIDDSIMSSGQAYVKIFLSDDDIEGIRQLAARPEFNYDWPRFNEFESIPVEKIPSEAIPEFKIEEALGGSGVKLKIFFVSNTTVVYSIKFWDEKAQEWISPFVAKTYDKRPNSQVINFTYNFTGPYKITKVEITLTPDNGESPKVIMKDIEYGL